MDFSASLGGLCALAVNSLSRKRRWRLTLDGGTRGRGDRGTGGQGDRGTGGQGDGGRGTGGRGDGGQGDRGTGDRGTGGQGDRGTGDRGTGGRGEHGFTAKAQRSRRSAKLDFLSNGLLCVPWRPLRLGGELFESEKALAADWTGGRGDGGQGDRGTGGRGTGGRGGSWIYREGAKVAEDRKVGFLI